MKTAFAILLLLAAAVIGLVELVAIVDPVGAKMADDGGPFDDPSVSWTQHATLIVAVLVLVGAAAFLLRRGKLD